MAARVGLLLSTYGFVFLLGTGYEGAAIYW